jgi:hypothetical protein
LCNIVVKQKQNEQFELVGNRRQESIPVSWESPTVIPILDEIVRAESTEEIFASGGSLMYSTKIRYTNKNGSQGTDSIELSNEFYKYPLLSPQFKIKTESTPQVVELDGEEELDEEPILQVKKESTNSYLITILNYRTNYDLRIRATKKGNKTYTFNAKTDSDGDIAIRAKRNLKGYKLELIESGKAILSKSISS